MININNYEKSEKVNGMSIDGQTIQTSYIRGEEEYPSAIIVAVLYGDECAVSNVIAYCENHSNYEDFKTAYKSCCRKLNIKPQIED